MEIEQLVKQLKNRYPDKLPTTEVTSYELGVLSGNIEVVQFIQSIIDKENYKANLIK